MTPRSSVLFALLACACACACGGSTSEGALDAGSGEGGNGTVDGGGTHVDGGGPPSDGGTIPTLSCGDENVTSIAGAWNVVSSQAGQQQGTSTLTIDANTFSFASDGKSLTFKVSGGTMSLVWNDSGRQTPITAARTASPLDTGLLSLSLGGQWTFSSTTDPESCTASVGGNAFKATCNDVRGTPFGQLMGTVDAQHTKQTSSIFGALGGDWHLSGAGGSVDVAINGNTFTAVVNDGGVVGGGGWLTVKVCNGMAVGKSRDGFEFAATRQ